VPYPREFFFLGVFYVSVMKMNDLASMTLEQLREWFVQNGHKAFRAQQVFKWIHGRCVKSFDEMTDLSKALRTRLEQTSPLRPPKILDEVRSSDGTIKFLLSVHGGQSIEAVWMPDTKRRTLCVSTQAGCAMGCEFCATGTMGLMRSLTAGEICGQVETVTRRLRSPAMPRPVSNVVFMGMGEPLANLDSTICAVEILLDDTGMGLSRRHITVSTIGLVPAMEEFAKRSPVKLAVSLNATTDEVRDKIMPINRRFPLNVLLKACRNLPLHGADRITFEYVMLAGINDSLQDANRLARLLNGIRCKVNLIPYNPTEGLGFERPTDQNIHAFQDALIAKDLSVFIRRSRGVDKHAACGQLVTSNRRRG